MNVRARWMAHRRIAGAGAVLACVMLLADGTTAAPARGDRAAAPARHWTGYRDAGDVVAIAPGDVEPIYETALRFYRPPSNQYRLLDLRLLPEAAGDTTARALSRPLAALLVSRLGDRFCLSAEHRRQNLGAELRVSNIYASSPDRARVIVGCRLDLPGGVSTDNAAQAFELVRTAKGWSIADRGGVGTPR